MLSIRCSARTLSLSTDYHVINFKHRGAMWPIFNNDAKKKFLVDYDCIILRAESSSIFEGDSACKVQLLVQVSTHLNMFVNGNTMKNNKYHLCPLDVGFLLPFPVASPVTVFDVVSGLDSITRWLPWDWWLSAGQRGYPSSQGCHGNMAFSCSSMSSISQWHEDVK